MYQEWSVFPSVQFDMMVQLDCGSKVLGPASFSLLFVITAGLLSILESTNTSGYNQDTGEWVELVSHYRPTPWFAVGFFLVSLSVDVRVCVCARTMGYSAHHKKYFGFIFKVAFILAKSISLKFALFIIVKQHACIYTTFCSKLTTLKRINTSFF